METDGVIRVHPTTIDLLLKEYTNITTYSETTSIEVGGCNILLVPWINEENRERNTTMINKNNWDIEIFLFL